MTEAQIIEAVAVKLEAPPEAEDPEQALTEKKQQAETLKQQFQPSAPEGKTLRIEFSDKTPEDVEETRKSTWMLASARTRNSMRSSKVLTRHSKRP
jgi:hypothetical protein